MNHTFTTRTWGSSKPTPEWVRITGIIFGVLLTLSVIGTIPGLVILMLAFMNQYAICPSCKKKVEVIRSAKAFSCYYCQSVVAKKNNEWQVIT